MTETLPGDFTRSARMLDLADQSAKLCAMKQGITPFTYVDLFAGIGGFHAMLDHAGGRCVYVSEIDREARQTYVRNWVDPLPTAQQPIVNTDITIATPDDAPVDVPNHDVLAAGFPCQPFSKSGYQRGMDEARGTLFWNIARILEERQPAVVLLENVRNLAGPRHRHEWEVIIQTLRELGYRVSSTPSVFSPHFLPPSLGGTPQVRDRVFILGTFVGPERAMAEVDVPPTVARRPVDGWNVRDWDAEWILDDDASIPDLAKYKLTAAETQWINVWDDLVQRMWSARGVRLPGFPLWADAWIPERGLDPLELEALPRWKSSILVKNARFYDEHRDIIKAWKKANPVFAKFPDSRRKLEWQAQDTASLWHTVMHFRPSGIRAKAPTYLPALVAITQTSIVGSRGRRLTPHEAARLQGLPRSFAFGSQRDQASYKQVGNGVAAGAAWHVFRAHVEQNSADLPKGLTRAVLNAPRNPSGDALSPSAHAFEADALERSAMDAQAG
ncbi:cytosine-specific DNA methylase [Janibacter sp. HTCC2649]|uniref:DNA cytosine methyltransferase n=1 Tax=Janibacter sp. HTCC2649 TaxID=313589 RepID=UPI0000671888|nr:DNA cytosine methyltransferase [Janibacter sp. HTCC2649]EAP97862.1 cytosine-specific DNA methylase [Janibacter sp. HTCC2649]